MIATELGPTIQRSISDAPVIQESLFDQFSGGDGFLESMLAGNDNVDMLGFISSYEMLTQPEFSGGEDTANIIQFPTSEAITGGSALSGDVIFSHVDTVSLFLNEVMAHENGEDLGYEGKDAMGTVVAHPALKARFEKYNLDDFDRVKKELSIFKEQYAGLYDQVVGDLMDRAAAIGAMCGGHSHESSKNTANSTNFFTTSSFLNENHSNCPTCGAEKESCICATSSESREQKAA